jgi:hypothetical protein
MVVPVLRWPSRLTRSMSRASAALLAMLSLSVAAMVVPPTALAAVRTFYVDCSVGNDTNSGTSTTAAWKTLARVNAAGLVAGDRVLLKRGCTFAGPLNARWTGTASASITIAAYGSGDLPRVKNADAQGNVVKITGSYLVLDGLQATADLPWKDPNCNNQPTGWRVGFAFVGGAYNTVRNSKAYNLSHGVQLSGASHHNKVLNSRLSDNIVLNKNEPGNGDDTGALGILLNGDYNEIAWNSFTGNRAICSYDFGAGEGISIELYKAQNNNIHHNFSTNDKAFVELGGDSTKQPNNNTFAYNRYANTVDAFSEFLNLRGTGNRVFNNTGYQTGSKSMGLSAPAGSLTAAKNNIFWANGNTAWAGGPIGESNNIFWSSDGTPSVNLSGVIMSTTSRKTNPKFENAGGGNYHLQSTSYGVDHGSSASVTAGYKTDLDGDAVPTGSAVDVGAFER